MERGTVCILVLNYNYMDQNNISKPFGLFKISFENVETGAVGYFFINGIDEILSQSIFSKQIRIHDGNTEENSSLKGIILKKMILKQLNQHKKTALQTNV